MCVCMHVCPSPPALTDNLINFKLGKGIAEDPRECSVECEFGRISGSGELHQPAPDGTCTCVTLTFDMRLIKYGTGT